MEVKVSVQYDIQDWRIQRKTRWYAVLGVAFGIAALHQFQFAVRFSLNPIPTALLFLLSGVFFASHWKEKRALQRTLSSAVANILPDEPAQGDTLSIEVVLPRAPDIQVTTWTASLMAIDEAQDKSEEKRDAVAVVSFSEGIGDTQGSREFVGLQCKLLIPEGSWQSRGGIEVELAWRVALNFGLKGGGFLAPQRWIPVQVTPQKAAKLRIM